MARERSLPNIKFLPLQPYDVLPALLKMGDCHLVVQKRGAADAVLPSKLTNILAVGGNAVITAEPHTELGQLCARYPGIAVCVERSRPTRWLTGLARRSPCRKTTRRHVNTPNARSIKRTCYANLLQIFGDDNASDKTLPGCDGRWLR
ncbi:glycosyltransferase [Salmonella enterica subsp. enterica]|nr:glycosyltransferase [Salmonella enterica subsp. enterica]